MKDTRSDLRTEKTYDALTAAFQEIIREKSFEKITVTELCTRAKTRTATFYNHFSDKYDFFSFMITRLRQQYMDTAEIDIDPTHPEEYYIHIVQLGFDFIEQHARMVENVESDTLLTTIMQSVSAGVTEPLQQRLAADLGDSHGNVSPEIMTQIFIGAMLQCSRWWFEHRRTVAKETVLEQLAQAIRQLYCA